MIQINDTSKVYIVSPYHKTGGPRSLHQLANLLTKYSHNVYIFYDEKKKLKNKELLYPECGAKLATNIEDDSNNIVITSEYDTGILLNLSKTKNIIWWLSLDYYLITNPLIYTKMKLRNQSWNKILGIPIFAKRLLFTIFNGKVNYFYKKNDLKKVNHLYNCEYVRNYLLKNNVSEKSMHYLCGPIISTKINKSIIKNKQDIVVYNPAKANKKILQRVIDIVSHLDKDIKFIALKDMDHNEVLEILSRAKLYIDLGYFPGPERTPREAVINFCNILTSTSGSAANNIDVPINNEYKFNLEGKGIETSISEKIINMINNYETDLKDFDTYRQKVYEQKERFLCDIKEIFGVKS